MWKVLNEKVSNDLNVTFYDNARRGIMAHVPPISPFSSLKSRTLFDSSFGVKGPQLWNLIPKSVKEKQTLFSFKRNLDKFLKNIPDTPPVSGYVAQNNNSLLDWQISRSN